MFIKRTLYRNSDFLYVNKNFNKKKLIKFLFFYLNHIPINHIYKLLKNSEIKVNFKKVKFDLIINLNDLIRIPPFFFIKRFNLFVNCYDDINFLKNVLYEDNKLLILSKLSGIASHKGSKNKVGLIEFFKKVNLNFKFSNLVNRLDKDTSGCILIAKNLSLLKELNFFLLKRKILKFYTAILIGLPPLFFVINVPLFDYVKRDNSTHIQKIKNAITYFKVISKYQDCSLVAIFPITGRTHQIRVHSYYAGYPILGDLKYNKNKYNIFLRKYKFFRLFLHSEGFFFKYYNRLFKIYSQFYIDYKFNYIINKIIK